MSNCTRHPLHASDSCPECHGSTRVYFTKGGGAYHASKDCPSLNTKRVHPVDFAKAIDARGRGKFACHQCVNGFCVRCAAGRHTKCDPTRDSINFCVCARLGHPG